MVEFNKDKLVLLSEASAFLPKRNQKLVHASTLHRWRSHGINGVKLHCFRIGAIWYTTQTAIEQFCNPTQIVQQPLKRTADPIHSQTKETKGGA